eukprot:1160187-Pelagomonas_calceolata.AAC.5
MHCCMHGVQYEVRGGGGLAVRLEISRLMVGGLGMTCTASTGAGAAAILVAVLRGAHIHLPAFDNDFTLNVWALQGRGGMRGCVRAPVPVNMPDPLQERLGAGQGRGGLGRVDGQQAVRIVTLSRGVLKYASSCTVRDRQQLGLNAHELETPND